MSKPVEWMTRREVAEMMRVSPMTITREIRRGNLKAVMVGGQYRVPESSIRDYVQRGCAVSA